MEFTEVGGHCSMKGCHQHDFLPFTCDCCSSLFCLEHRNYKDHECPKSNMNDHRIIHCPLCEAALRINNDEDPNITWEKHAASGTCNNDGKSSKKKKERCASKSCTTILLTSNQMTCLQCSRKLCITHRFPKDHDCHLKLKKGKDKIVQGVDACPVCKKTFRYTSQLLAHMKHVHEKGPEGNQAQICPICNRQFSSLPILIQHAQNCKTTETKQKEEKCMLM